MSARAASRASVRCWASARSPQPGLRPPLRVCQLGQPGFRPSLGLRQFPQPDVRPALRLEQLPKPLLSLTPELGKLLGQGQQLVAEYQAAQFRSPFRPRLEEADQIVAVFDAEGHTPLYPGSGDRGPIIAARGSFTRPRQGVMTTAPGTPAGGRAKARA
jgi:hypothetical protein